MNPSQVYFKFNICSPSSANIATKLVIIIDGNTIFLAITVSLADYYLYNLYRRIFHLVAK